MKSTRFPSVLWIVPLAFATLACPTRTVPFDAGGDMAGSGGRKDSGTDRVGVGGAGGVGMTGTAGRTGSAGSGTGEVAGSGATGTGGAIDTGGATGTGGAIGTGGATGTGGAIGTGGATGTGGVNSTGGIGAIGGTAGGGGSSFVSGYVVCGSVTNCPLGNGGQCCYSELDQSSACQGIGASCESVVPMGANPGHEKTTIACDSSDDCPSNEICCYSNVYVGSSTACAPAASCVDMSPPGPGGYTTYRRQVCNPSKVAPTECLSGTCQTSTTYSLSLPPYLYLCL